ncbi:hypothetical protein EJB05_16742, partial [Eragrostis curvula]
MVFANGQESSEVKKTWTELPSVCRSKCMDYGGLLEHAVLSIFILKMMLFKLRRLHHDRLPMPAGSGGGRRRQGNYFKVDLTIRTVVIPAITRIEWMKGMERSSRSVAE